MAACRTCKREYGKGWGAQAEAEGATTCRDCAFRESAFGWGRGRVRLDVAPTLVVTEVVVTKATKAKKGTVKRKR